MFIYKDIYTGYNSMMMIERIEMKATENMKKKIEKRHERYSRD